MFRYHALMLDTRLTGAGTVLEGDQGLGPCGSLVRYCSAPMRLS